MSNMSRIYEIYEFKKIANFLNSKSHITFPKLEENANYEFAENKKVQNWQICKIESFPKLEVS